jgi:hypothetical protein
MTDEGQIDDGRTIDGWIMEDEVVKLPNGPL